MNSSKRNDHAPKDPAPAGPPARGGCQDFRLGLVLAALERRLTQNLSPEEKAAVKARIASLEAEMGL